MPVVPGSASIQQAGNLLKITNAPNAIINWQSFSIGANEITRFIQQSASSAVLNRVITQNPSSILGALQSNGRVFLINPNGIVFGAGAQVNVAGLVASTLNFSDADFLAGRLRFSDAAGAGSIVNQGSINAGPGGSVYLVGPAVTNSGIITSPKGEVVLAAGNSVELVNPGTPNLRVEISAPDNQAVNLGSIVADAGRVGIYAGLINHSGTIRADSAVAGENGQILLKATKSAILDTGSLTSASGGTQGGNIEVTAPVVLQAGDIKADGNAGGKVQIGATNFLQAGTISASGSAGAGGEINVNAPHVIQTSAALMAADGSGGNGGSITLNASGAPDGLLFSSAKFSATGAKGGAINLLGHDIVLLGAQADASGANGGGTILVGGDFQGKNPAVPNAATTGINFSTALKADAMQNGDGGKVIVWSDGDTKFYGTASARGGAQSGNGGFMEISGKQNLTMGGFADAGAPNGTPGTLLLDPKNIVIDSAGGGLGSFQLVDPHPGTGEFFGNFVTVLGNQNVVVRDQNDSFAASHAGAVYLYNSATGALISALTGSTANDNVGSNGLTILGNGNFLIRSPSWNNGAATSAGALTFANPTTGVSGVVSSANSLVGSSLNDFVGLNGVITLSNGNYLVLSPYWGNTGGNQSTGLGAVTFGSGTAGVSGVVSASNSLVGGTAGDLVGSNYPIELSTGNYVVSAPAWHNGAAANAGAVTFGSGTTGVTGVMSASNSLVGNAAGDQVGGSGISTLSTGNYLVRSLSWGGGAGAVTFGSGTAGVTGAVSSANSLVGSISTDQIGSNGVFELPNGNYVVVSPNWTNSNLAETYLGATATNAGAVTFGSGTTGVSGTVSSANSLVGTLSGTYVGRLGAPSLPNSNYVVVSDFWGDGTNAPQTSGAVTWINGATGNIAGTSSRGGVVSPANSLVGSSFNDFVGGTGFVSSPFIFTSNGVRIGPVGNNYVVLSNFWNNSTGAVTLVNGTNGNIIGTSSPGGVVSAANSLVGSRQNTTVSIYDTGGDQVGSGGVTFVGGSSNYVVRSLKWNSNAGAATFVNGTTGLNGVVSSANSLVGNTAGDNVGSNVTVLANGNYVVSSPSWNSSTGAATFGSGATGVSGLVSSANSLVGSTAGDYVGNITTLSNGNYLVASPSWSGNTGAVTFGSGTTGVSGVISLANSLVGSAAGDSIGSNITVLANDNYLVTSSSWNSNAGAVTFGSGTTGVSGAVSSANSLVGSAAGDQVGNYGITELASGNYVVLSPYWNGSIGAVTFGSGTTGVSGTVSAANSLVGSTGGDLVGYNGIRELANGNYVVLSPNWSNTNLAETGGSPAASAGAVTFGDGTTGVKGVVSSANSLVGSHTNDGSSQSVYTLNNGNYVVKNYRWNSGMGAVTFASGTSGISGVISAANSLVGSTPDTDINPSGGDHVGGDGIFTLSNGNYLVQSSDWNNTNLAETGGSVAIRAGAVTFGSGTTGVKGVVSSANSLVGGSSNDQVGLSFCDCSANPYISELPNGNYVVGSTFWNNPVTGASNAGAATPGSGTTGISGLISSANSLVGSATNDLLGSNGIRPLANGNFILQSPDAANGALNSAGLLHVVTSGGTAAGQTFAANPGATATMTPSAITAITNTGTAVTLQANNDITLNPASDIVTSAGGAGGALTMQAGRNIALNSNINTDNGTLTLVANESTTNGVIAANRDPGAGGISMAPGVTLNAGTGNIFLRVGDGTGHSGATTASNLVFENLIANNVSIINDNLNSGSNILRGSASSLLTATTSAFMELEFAAGATDSIGTSAAPIRVSTPALEAHYHNAGGGIFIDSPNASDLQIGGVPGPIFSGLVRGVQTVSGGPISIKVNGNLTQLAGTAACGLTGGTGGPICDSTGAGSITLLANGITVNNLIDAATGNVTLQAGGPINQTGGSVRGALLATSSVGGQALTGANLVGSFNATNTGSGNIQFTDTAAPLTIAGISEAGGGSVTVTNTGSINTSGAINADGDVTLAALGPSSNFTLSNNIAGTGVAGKTLTMQAGNNIVFGSGANVSAANALNVVLNSDRDASGAGSIQMLPGSSITTNGGNIVMGGGADPLTNPATGLSLAGAHGIHLEGAALNSGAGNISLIGKGSLGDGSTAAGWGIVAYGGTTISASGGTIKLDGTGGAGSNGNRGVYVQDSGTIIQSTNGDISIVGKAAAGVSTIGTMLANGPQIISTGTAKISLTGITAGTGSFNPGVRLEGAGNLIQSINGDISITGTGTGSGIENYGVWLNSGAGIISTGSAAITLVGTGASGNAGIFAGSASGSNMIGGPSAAGPISLTALANDVSLTSTAIQSSGQVALSAQTNVNLNAAAIIAARGGAVTLNSDSAGTGAGNIQMLAGSSISTGGGSVVMGGGTNPLTGYAQGTGSTQTSSSGIYIAGDINAGAGNVTMHGKGASGFVPGDGIAFVGGTLTSNGSVTIDGVAQASHANPGCVGVCDFVAGVHFANSGIRLTTATGTVNVTGLNSVANTRTQGITLDAATVETTGTGTLTLNGTSTPLPDTNWGVGILFGGTVRTTAAGGGAVTVIGNASPADGGIVLLNGNLTSGGGEIRMLSQAGGVAVDGSTIGGAGSGNILVKMSDASPVNVVNGGTLNAGDSALTLSLAGGTFNDSNAITAGGLRLLGSGTFSLGGPSSNVGTLAANVASGVTYTNAAGLTIGSVTSFDGTAQTTTAGVTAGGPVSITSPGVLNITSPVSAGVNAVNLTSSGALSESGAGAVSTTGLLTTNSAGGQTLGGANAVGSINATNATSGNFLFNNTTPLAIAGIGAAAGGSVTVTNTGALNITGTVSAGSGAVNLTSSGALSESGAGLISTTGLLTTSSAGGQTLGGANAVGSINATNATSGNLQFTNAAAPLTIAGISETGGNATITNTGAVIVTGAASAGGGLAINTSDTLSGTGTITGATTSLNSANGMSVIVGSSGAGLSVSNTGTTGDVVLTSTAPLFTVGSGGATFSNSAPGGRYFISATTDLTLNNPGTGNANDRFAQFGAGNMLTVNGYSNPSGLGVLMAANNVTFSGATNVSGALSVLAAGIDVNANVQAGSVNVVTNALNVNGGDFQSAAANFTGAVSGDINVMSGGRIYGNPDVDLTVGGTVFINGVASKIEALSPTSIHVSFPLLSTGGYTINGVPGTVWDPQTSTGFFAGGLPAVLGQSLVINYGIAGAALPPTVIAAVNTAVNAVNTSGQTTGGEPQTEKDKDKETDGDKEKSGQITKPLGGKLDLQCN